METMTDADLRSKLLELAPWHLGVEVRPGINTEDALLEGELRQQAMDKHGAVGFIDDEARHKRILDALYPAGLAGRSFLDIACNCGGYSFWAKDKGAGRTHGLDVREHWIRQAQFLQEQRNEDDMTFEVRDLYDLPALGAEPFDVTLFKGILYHIPRPMEALRIAAEQTKELMIVDTASRLGLGSSGWVMGQENVGLSMNGVYSVNWYPTGPKPVEATLGALGFTEIRRIYVRRVASKPTRQAGFKNYARRMAARTGRFAIAAARSPEVFEAFDKSGYVSEAPEGW